jgi:hypothetical protein
MFDSKRHGSGGDEEATLGLEEALVAVRAAMLAGSRVGTT